MLIRVQRDDTLVNINAMERISISESNAICAYRGDKAIRLGSYPSNTRANIVLNKIGEAYGKKSLFEMPESHFDFD